MTPTVNTRMSRADAAWALVRAEIERATKKHGPMNSMHEGYAVLLEEVDELWDDVKKDRHGPALIEAVQVAAMAIRIIVDRGNWIETEENTCASGHTDPAVTQTLVLPPTEAQIKEALHLGFHGFMGR